MTTSRVTLDRQYDPGQGVIVLTATTGFGPTGSRSTTWPRRFARRGSADR